MSSKPIIEKLPLWFLFLIVSSGFFIVLSFPYDIFQLDFSGLEVPKDITSSFKNWVTLSISEFSPFTNVKYLDVNFPVGFTQITLVSMVFGTVVYVLYNLYTRINSKIMGGRISGKFKVQLEKKPSDVEAYEFSKWL